MKKRVLIIGIAVALAALAAVLLFSRRGSAEPKFRKAKVDKGEVVATVTATGTLSAVTTVQVGSQVSGIIAKLHVDFNSIVKKGQLLAELDPTPFQQTDRAAARGSREGESGAPERGDLAHAREEPERAAAPRAVRSRRGADDAGLGRGRGRAGAGGVEAGRDEPVVHADHVAHRRRRREPAVRRRSDGRRVVPGAGSLHDRAGPHEDAGAHEHRRGGRGPDPRRPGRELLGRRLPGHQLQGDGRADTPVASDGAERRHVPGHAGRPERRPEAQAGHDRERPGSRGRPQGRPARAERGAALPAGQRRSRPRGAKGQGEGCAFRGDRVVRAVDAVRPPSGDRARSRRLRAPRRPAAGPARREVAGRADPAAARAEAEGRARGREGPARARSTSRFRTRAES